MVSCVLLSFVDCDVVVLFVAFLFLCYVCVVLVVVIGIVVIGCCCRVFVEFLVSFVLLVALGIKKRLLVVCVLLALLVAF